MCVCVCVALQGQGALLAALARASGTSSINALAGGVKGGCVNRKYFGEHFLLGAGSHLFPTRWVR